jgi:hypothetical protein
MLGVHNIVTDFKAERLGDCHGYCILPLRRAESECAADHSRTMGAGEQKRLVRASCQLDHLVRRRPGRGQLAAEPATATVDFATDTRRP